MIRDSRLIAPLAMCVALAGCGGGTPDAPAPQEPLTVYSGRSEQLVGPLIDRFRQATGREVRVRYGGTAELAATLLEEGRNSPAQLFLSQDVAELGALSSAGLLRPLPPELLARVPARFHGPQRDWVGLSGRARVVVYNTRVAPSDLPQSLEQVTEPRYRGRFGVAPTNASFQAHMGLYLALNGEPALDRLLRGMAANEPRVYSGNSPIVQAVIAGEIDWGLVNHYYLWRALKEQPDAGARNFFMPESAGTGSSFLNLSGVGVLAETPGAIEFVGFLLSDESQRYFAEETFEYPLAPGVAPAADLPPVETLLSPTIDPGQIAGALPAAQRLIQDSGLTRFQ